MSKSVIIVRFCLSLILVLGLSLGFSTGFSESGAIPALVDYVPQPSLDSESVLDFTGIWVPILLEYDGVFYDFQSGVDATMGFEIFGGKGIEYSAGENYYMPEMNVVDGKLSFLEEDGPVELTLHENYDISYSASGLTLYLRKIFPDYQSVDYISLMRNPENYIDTYVLYTGVVLQTVGSRTGDFYQVRLDVGDDQVIFVEFINPPAYNLLEGDTITILGRLAGEYTYEAVWGNQVTIPLLFAHDVELVDVRGPEYVVPYLISKARYDQFTGKMSAATRKKVAACYTEVTESYMQSHPSAYSLIAINPDVLNGGFHVIRSGLPQSNLSKLEEYFKDAGYKANDCVADGGKYLWK